MLHVRANDFIFRVVLSVQSMHQSLYGKERLYNRRCTEAVRRMKKQQFYMLVAGLATVAFTLYWTITLQMYWYVICLIMLEDCLAFGGMISTILSCRRRKQATANNLGDSKEQVSPVYDAGNSSSTGRSRLLNNQEN